MKTHIYCVRHAQPVHGWAEDSTRPLSEYGMQDREKVTEALMSVPIDLFISSPYKRSYDTIAHLAEAKGMPIETDKRFVERGVGVNGFEALGKRWEDFEYAEEGGESLGSVQRRNIEALKELLEKHTGKNIVLGTHGTALSMIIQYYRPAFNLDDFMRIFGVLPYVVRLDFEGDQLVGSEELLMVKRGY